MVLISLLSCRQADMADTDVSKKYQPAEYNIVSKNLK